MNTSHCLLLLIALIVGTVPAGAQESVAGESPSAEARQRAAAAFEQGLAFSKEDRLEDALVEFQTAYDLAPHHAVLFNIAQVHQQLGDHASALHSLQDYLRLGGDDIAAARRKEVNLKLAELESQVSRLIVDAETSGATVTLDGDQLGETPMTQPHIANPGGHVLRVSKTGHREYERQLFLAPGATATIVLTLEPLKSVSEEAPVKDQLESSNRARDSARAKTAGWAASGTLLIAGVLTGILALEARSDLQQLSGPVAAGAAEERRAKLKSTQNRVSSLALSSDLLVAAGLLTGGVTAYFQFRSPNQGEASFGLGFARRF